jgi:hypothetical protein
VISAHILGSWTLDWRALGLSLDMGALCAFLAGERFSDRVFKVSHVTPKGNAANFNNLSLYIRRECLTKWKDDGSDQTTVYVNVYSSGKCSVIAAPDEEVCGLKLLVYEALSYSGKCSVIAAPDEEV